MSSINILDRISEHGVYSPFIFSHHKINILKNIDLKINIIEIRFKFHWLLNNLDWLAFKINFNFGSL